MLLRLSCHIINAVGITNKSIKMDYRNYARIKYNNQGQSFTEDLLSKTEGYWDWKVEGIVVKEMTYPMSDNIAST